MRIFPGERRATLSVGELAGFGLGPTTGFKGPSGLWRAELGREWHSALRAESDVSPKGDAEVRHEVTIRGVFVRDGWTIEMEGRVDKLSENNGKVLATELKTTFFPLPATEQRLREKYPHYFLQLATYLALLRLLPEHDGKDIEGELLFVDVSGSGFTQTVPIASSDQFALEQRLVEILIFFEERRRSRSRLSELVFTPPFDTLREGQSEVLESLEKTCAFAPVTLFEAPTGFGKTGTALSYGLQCLRSGLCDRILYLTSKSTGQNEVIKTLGKMFKEQGGLRYLFLRNRAERNIGFEELDNLTRDELDRRWKVASIAPVILFRDGTISEESLRDEAKRTGLPPYEILRVCLPFADLWIGDFNYVFHPGSTALLRGISDYIPSRTLLLIDEAHNLPSRVASGLSVRFSMAAAFEVAEVLSFEHGPKALIGSLDDWVAFLGARQKNEVLDSDGLYRANDLIETVAEALRKEPLPLEKYSLSMLESIWLFCEADRLLSAEALPKRLWSPEDHAIEITCLDAASHIGSEIRTFGLCLLASGTLSPIQEFAMALGLEAEDYNLVQGTAPWRNGSMKTAIDTQVDTRFTSRRRYLDDTASTILTLSQYSNKAVAVFFPSFRYAEEAFIRLRAISSDIRLSLQPRFSSVAEANGFLTMALSGSNALFLVLGSVFSEGIDVLGGQVDIAMIVSPALPEVNPLQEAKMQALSTMGRKEAFRRTYLIPGMRKVNQALGRLVRVPGHRARVLLHCRRFAEPVYRELLDPVCRDASVLQSPEEMLAWLTTEENSVALPS